MTRDDLDELHALAAEISEEAQGWRVRRRQRSVERAEKRAYEEMVSPLRRRRRHRIVAGSVVVLVVAGLAIAGVVIHNDTHHHVPATPSPDHIAGRSLADIRAGREAAGELDSQGRVPNTFSCQAWYDSHQFVVPAGQNATGFHAGFLNACLNAASNNANPQ